MIKILYALAAALVSCTALAQAPSTNPEPAGPAPKSLEEIFSCLAAGLPKDWHTATVEVIEVDTDGKERRFEARYAYTGVKAPKPVKLLPCDATGPAKNVHELNQFLEPDKRQWKRAMLTFRSDGKFELKYDYTK